MARLPFIVALLNYAFALPGYVYMNAVTGTGATRITFIFQTVTIVAYQIYLWSISYFSTSLSVYWTAEYFICDITLDYSLLSISKTRTIKSLNFLTSRHPFRVMRSQKLSININVL